MIVTKIYLQFSISFDSKFQLYIWYLHLRIASLMLLGPLNHTSWIFDISYTILTWSGKQLSSCVKPCCLVTQIAGLKTNLNWSGVSFQQRTKLRLYNLLITHSRSKRNAKKKTTTITERVLYTSAGRVYNSKPVDLRFESSWKSTRNFHFTRLTCNFSLKVDQHLSISAQLVEHLILILQSLRFESSCKFMLSFYSAVRVLCSDFEWGLNPHKFST